MAYVQEHRTCWFVFSDNGLLLRCNNSLPDSLDVEPIKPYFQRHFNLGTLDSVNYYCAEMGKDTATPDTFDVLPLKSALSLFNDSRYGMAVKAYSVISWDKNHQFCSRCGSTTVHQDKNFERHCSSCHLSFFPRISPSIIVLIKKDDYLLMARSPHFAPGVYGLIAGFVEVGESIEETVHREVQEEVGLQIKNLSYVGSQPWPFPDSLMLAFTADYAGGAIVIDQDEIEEAGWYKYDNLPGRPSVALSIASELINDFVKNHQEQEKGYQKYWPAEWEQGLIKTENAMGVMFKELSPSAASFVQFAKYAQYPLLDIGAAFGSATIPALENGATVIACDLSGKHLQILRQSVDNPLIGNLTTLTAAFPYELNFESESLSGILISNVLHFMDGETIVHGLNQCWQWLQPNGKLFITVMTPHLSFYHQFLPEYEKRVEEGCEWPGIFNPRLVASEKWQDNLPEFVHLFELEVIKKMVEQAGFTIETIEYFCYKNYPEEHRTDGKEFISLCAVK
ncbi:MAG: NAD(+) diphosphatase [Legionellales bacterium]